MDSTTKVNHLILKALEGNKQQQKNEKFENKRMVASLNSYVNAKLWELLEVLKPPLSSPLFREKLKKQEILTEDEELIINSIDCASEKAFTLLEVLKPNFPRSYDDLITVLKQLKFNDAADLLENGKRIRTFASMGDISSLQKVHVNTNLMELLKSIPLTSKTLTVSLVAVDAITEDEKQSIDAIVETTDKGYELLRYLQPRFPISFDKLIQVLKHLKAETAVQILEKFYELNPQAGRDPEAEYEISALPTRTITDADISKIASFLEEDKLACLSRDKICLELGLRPHQHQGPTNFSCFMNLLVYWRSTVPKSASVVNLVRILTKLNLNSVANQIKTANAATD